MFRRSLLALLVSFGLVCPPAFAVDPPDPKAPITVELEVVVPEEQPTAPTTTEVRELLGEAREMLDGDDETDSFVMKWLKKFHVPKLVLNAYRFYLLKSGNIRTADHAANMVTLFTLSHGTEVLVGSALTAFAVSTGDLHWTLRGLLATIGVGITIPGFDPLCYAAFGSYFKWPNTMNYALTPFRFVLVKVGGTVLKYTGVTPALNYVFTREDGAKFLTDKLTKAKPGIYKWSATVDKFQFALLGGSGKALADFEMKRQADGALAITTLTVDRKATDADSRKHLVKMLRPFGWNVQNAVVEAFDAGLEWHEDFLAQFKKRGFVESVDDSNPEKLVVTFKEPAIRLGNHVGFRPWRWAKGATRWCRDLIAGGGKKTKEAEPET